jgi:hypothetical protein
MNALRNPFLTQKAAKPARQTRIVIGSEPWRDRKNQQADFDPFSGLESWLRPRDCEFQPKSKAGRGMS